MVCRGDGVQDKLMQHPKPGEREVRDLRREKTGFSGVDFVSLTHQGAEKEQAQYP